MSSGGTTSSGTMSSGGTMLTDTLNVVFVLRILDALPSSAPFKACSPRSLGEAAVALTAQHSVTTGRSSTIFRGHAGRGGRRPGRRGLHQTMLDYCADVDRIARALSECITISCKDNARLGLQDVSGLFRVGC